MFRVDFNPAKRIRFLIAILFLQVHTMTDMKI